MLRDWPMTPPANRADMNTARRASRRPPGAPASAKRRPNGGLGGLGSAACFVGVALALLAASPSCGLNADGLGGGGPGGHSPQGGGGAAAQCNVPEECIGTDTACWHRTCTQGLCSPMIEPAGTPCQENGGKVCDGNSTCVECLDATQCAPNELCPFHQCVPSHCVNGQLDASETDIDCGGADCGPCANDQHCNLPAECLSGFCDTSGGGGGGGMGAGICTACSGDGQCTGNPQQWCDLGNVNGGTCTPKKNPGDSCDGGNQCLSGFCPDGDGVCCDNACSATCQACLLAKTGQPNGTCALVAADQDPDGECSDQGPCGANGTGCTGTATACKVYPPATPCGSQTCVGNTLKLATDYTCNGAGSCVAGSGQPCQDNFTCADDGQNCRTSCSDPSHCIANTHCDGGDCLPPPWPNGDPCTQGQDCTSGNCPSQDHVCCDASCNGTCVACLNSKNGGQGDGHCANVPDHRDPDNECSGSNDCNGNAGCH